MFVDVAVNVSKEEGFSSPFTMKREKWTVPRLSCTFARSGINEGSCSSSALALPGDLIGKSMLTMALTWTHRALSLGVRIGRGSPRTDHLIAGHCRAMAMRTASSGETR